MERLNNTDRRKHIFWERILPHCHFATTCSTWNGLHIFFRTNIFLQMWLHSREGRWNRITPVKQTKNYSYILARYWLILFWFICFSVKICWPDFSVFNEWDHFVYINYSNRGFNIDRQVSQKVVNLCCFSCSVTGLYDVTIFVVNGLTVTGLFADVQFRK